MGYLTTPKYRVTFDSIGMFRMTPAAWQGRASSKRLREYCEHLVASFKPGGVNDQIGRTGLVLTGAHLVRQGDNVEVATWKA